MWITMLETRRGCEDGFTVQRFEKGNRYDVSIGLAKRLMKNGGAYNSEPEENTGSICDIMNNIKSLSDEILGDKA